MGTDSGPFPFGTCSAVRISPQSISFQAPTANNDPLSPRPDKARPPRFVPCRAFSRVYDHARVAAKRSAPVFATGTERMTAAEMGDGIVDAPDHDVLIIRVDRVVLLRGVPLGAR